MNSYSYEAVNAGGLRVAGAMEVDSLNEVLARLKQMGLFPTRVVEARPARRGRPGVGCRTTARAGRWNIAIPGVGGRVKPRALTVFTRQLATLTEAGMPLLRGLRVLQEQERNPTLKRVVGEISEAIEGGSTLTEAMSLHPRVFNPLYVNMVRAGEVGGVLELTLKRLAEFMEKAQKIKGKVKAAMFYPAAVITVATAIMAVMMVYVVPKFQEVFAGLLPGGKMPAFTLFVLRISDVMRHNALAVGCVAVSLIVLIGVGIRTNWGRWFFDKFKLSAPILGPVFKKSAISRFARTLGTLLGSGVPVLQALTIVKETAGNAVLAGVVGKIHSSVKEGESLTQPLRASKVIPPLVVGMVDVGEQTGALPDMLLKIADGCDDDVDNAVSAMTSLLEPIMIVFLAVIVGSIVIAMFLPILILMNPPDTGQGGVADS